MGPSYPAARPARGPSAPPGRCRAGRYGPSDRMPGTPEEVSPAQPEGVSSRLGGRGRPRRRRPVHARQPRHPQAQSGAAVVRRRGGVRRPQDHRRGLPAARRRHRPRQPRWASGSSSSSARRASRPTSTASPPPSTARTWRCRTSGRSPRAARQGTIMILANRDVPPLATQGAGDNASGVAAMLALRGRLHGHRPRAHPHLPVHDRRRVRRARRRRVRRRPTDGRPLRRHRAARRRQARQRRHRPGRLERGAQDGAAVAVAAHGPGGQA